ncbi:hypothetical protein CRUP_021566 [Coryphaenoides rupestris]|nr:hypothetical protein CRUP_021566 [Coryphaenoides rupestris]
MWTVVVEQQEPNSRRPAPVLQWTVSLAGVKVHILGSYIHRRFQLGRYDNDLVVLHLATPLEFGPSLFPLCLPTKDFSENVLMHAGNPGLTWLGRGSEVVTYMTLYECHHLFNASHPISNKMFCMAAQNSQHGKQEVAGRWRASPVASQHRETVFLTGLLLSTSPGKRGQEPHLLYTKLSRFLPWLTGTLNRIQENVTPQVRQYPEPEPGGGLSLKDDVTHRRERHPLNNDRPDVMMSHPSMLHPDSDVTP